MGKLISIEKISEVANEVGLSLFSDYKEYEHNRSKLKWLCLKGHITVKTYFNIQQGRGCRGCFLERLAAKRLSPEEKRIRENTVYAPRRRIRGANRVKTQRVEAKRLKSELKNGPCTDCNQSFPAYCMDFDHLPGQEKKFKLSESSFVNLDKIKEEIRKCELVCAICHRRRTYLRTNRSARKRYHQDLVSELKKKPCELCCKSYEPYLMDFDHLDQKTKFAKISDMMRRKTPLDIFLKEIAKCRLLCAICHRIHTEKQLFNHV